MLPSVSLPGGREKKQQARSKKKSKREKGESEEELLSCQLYQ